MKKIFIFATIVFTIGFLLAFTKKNNDYLLDYFDKDEVSYIEKNDISFESISPYMKYNKFNIYNFYQYEILRNNSSYYLEAINKTIEVNYYKPYTDIKKALFHNQLYILVNKHYFLEKDYTPNDLDYIENYNLNYIKRENEIMKGNKNALQELERMSKDALNIGLELTIFSSYRDFNRQEYLYYVVNMSNDNYSAKPGHSEHQTGLAFDISSLNYGLTTDFKYSEEYKWLISNCYKYGFILRYPDNKTNITLYNYEPWHFRYVGKSIALNIYNNNITLEEFIIRNYEL